MPTAPPVWVLRFLYERIAVEQINDLFHWITFRVRDRHGVGAAAAVMPSVKWVHLPYYAVGVTAYLTPGCLYTEAARQHRHGNMVRSPNCTKRRSRAEKDN